MMLGQRHKQWANIDLTLGERLVVAVYLYTNWLNNKKIIRNVYFDLDLTSSEPYALHTILIGYKIG